MANAQNIRAGRAYVELGAERGKLDGELLSAEQRIRQYMTRSNELLAKSRTIRDTNAAAANQLEQRARALASQARVLREQESGRAALAGRLEQFKAQRAAVEQHARAQGAAEAKAELQGRRAAAAGGEQQQDDSIWNKRWLQRGVKVAAYAQAIGGALSLVNIAIQAHKGNWDAVDEALKRLPMGVGRVYRELQNIIGAVTGLTDAIDEQQRKLAEMAKASKAGEQALGIRGQIDNDLALARMNEEQKAITGINQARDTQIQKLRELEQASGINQNSTIRRVNQLADERIRAIELENESARRKADTEKAISSDLKRLALREADARLTLSGIALEKQLLVIQQAREKLQTVGYGNQDPTDVALQLAQVSLLKKQAADSIAEMLRGQQADIGIATGTIAAFQPEWDAMQKRLEELGATADQVREAFANFQQLRNSRALAGLNEQFASLQARMDVLSGKTTEKESRVAAIRQQLIASGANAADAGARATALVDMQDRVAAAEKAKGDTESLKQFAASQVESLKSDSEKRAEFMERLAESVKAGFLTQAQADAAAGSKSFTSRSQVGTFSSAGLGRMFGTGDWGTQTARNTAEAAASLKRLEEKGGVTWQ